MVTIWLKMTHLLLILYVNELVLTASVGGGWGRTKILCYLNNNAIMELILGPALFVREEGFGQ